jgi:cytochrome c oxidase subunit II
MNRRGWSGKIATLRFEMKSKHTKAAMKALTVLWAAALAPAAHAAWGLNMTEGVTDISRRVYGLHMTIFWICCVIAVIVFGVMIYSMVVFRKSRGAVPDTKFVHSTKMEVVWTVIPVLILVFSAVPAARTLLETENASNTELTILATGYQWRWGYQYVDSGVSFFSALDRASNEARQLQSGIDPNTVPDYLLSVDRPLVVPAGTKIRVLLTAQDVIHAWWVPALAVKRDAIPGFTNEVWFKVDTDKVGLYRGQCAELCGRDHGFMPIVVDVRSKEDFARWLAEQKTAAAAAAAAAPVTAAATPAAAAAAG